MIGMTNKLKHHPTFANTQDIIDICNPLAVLGISTFSHVKVLNDSSMTGIVTNPDFFENYLKKHHYNIDIHADPKHCHLLNCLMWDNIDAKGQVSEMLQDAAAFNYNSIFSIIKKSEDQTDIYHFGTHLKNKTINQMYINNYDLLEKFIVYFNEKVSHSKQLKSAYDIKIKFKSEQSLMDQDDSLLLPSEEYREQFLSLSKTQFSSIFTPRENQLIPMLILGYTSKQMAVHLGLSCRTVESYLAALKTKLHVQNKSELISKVLMEQTTN